MRRINFNQKNKNEPEYLKGSFFLLLQIRRMITLPFGCFPSELEVFMLQPLSHKSLITTKILNTLVCLKEICQKLIRIHFFCIKKIYSKLLFQVLIEKIQSTMTNIGLPLTVRQKFSDRSYLFGWIIGISQPLVSDPNQRIIKFHIIT